METSEDTRQYVLFRLGPEEYGLPVSTVSSIIRYEQPTPVPQAPPQVDGVINVRGRVIPVVNLLRALSGRDEPISAMSRIVITEGDAGTVGVVVDSANEVATIPLSTIVPAPESVLSAVTAEAFEGVADVGGRLVILVRLDTILPRVAFSHSSHAVGPASAAAAAGDDAAKPSEGDTDA